MKLTRCISIVLLIFMLILTSCDSSDTSGIEITTKDGVMYLDYTEADPKITLTGNTERVINNQRLFETLVDTIDGKPFYNDVCNCEAVYVIRIGKYTFGLHRHNSITVFSGEGVNFDNLIGIVNNCPENKMNVMFDILSSASNATDSSLPELDEDEDEYETIEYDQIQNVYGTITEKLGSDTLVLKPRTPKQIEQCGETVYIITEKADEWCVNDEIDVTFYKMQCPKSTDGIKRIIAYEVMPLFLSAKPIIYFYPEEATQCSAELTMTNGYLTCTYPEYNNKGWSNFTAQPDGTLIFPDGKEYYALYWEGVNNTEWDFSTGFCVSGKDTMRFLEWALAKQGLTPREANEFIIYWLPLMQENPYNVISFQKEAYTESAVLTVSPTPQSMLRVFMAYYPSDTEIDIKPQELDEFSRSGFTVVEWGGSIAVKP